jgi:limonene-1,2-epoxide hydrolase
MKAKTQMVFRSVRTLVVPSMVAVASMAIGMLFTACIAEAQQPATPTTSWNSYERTAVEIVNAWAAAWSTKDPQKIASYMSDDVEYRDMLSMTESRKGRDRFIADYNKFMNTMDSMTVTSTYAVGGEAETIVIHRRIDQLTMKGKAMSSPYAGVFLVKDGKIVNWLDVPMNKMSGPPPPAPK